ncbi:carboxypeptidase [Paracoccus sp. PAR01]|nr:carboxypeptidase [Paracoccus sp. PAR01]
MQPVREAYYLGSKADAYRKKLRYYPWYGRGFAQLTWQYNYQRAGKQIGIDLIANPDAAMEPDNAARVLVLGSRDGWFTGKKLSDYINASKTDYTGARRIINGTDRAADIAAIAKEYAAALAAESPERQVQSILASLGLYTSKIDGIWGPKSQAALDAFNLAAGRIAALSPEI